MSRYWNYQTTYEQLSAQELRQKAHESVTNAKKKGRVMEPVIPHSDDIATSWWGQAWCQNIEKYADYKTRLSRGKHYILSGAVIDLKIQKGKIISRVQGNRKAPYCVEIRISRLSEERIQAIMKQCSQKIENMEELIKGNFPDDLKDLFTGDEGLFPNPTEINYFCSCPDWALMCKHVAATLYGVAVRFDENPFLFFELRGIDIDRFIDIALKSRVEMMLDHSNNLTSRVIDDDRVFDIFKF
ncbi:MAG: hypothetical protein LUH02_03330 [Erysipelotrichaceae bacterium]|nr:hypothetical protein [Erysipelotrichaceae bacterium]